MTAVGATSESKTTQHFINPETHTPVQVNLGFGYTQARLRQGSVYHGPHYEVSLGQTYRLKDTRHAFSVSGAFRQAFLFNTESQSRPLSQLSFGLEGEYRFDIKPYFSPFVQLGLGANIFYTSNFITGSYQGFGGSNSLEFQINNEATLGLKLGLGFRLFKFLSVSGAYQGAYGLKLAIVDAEGNTQYETRSNLQGLSASASFDIAPMIEHKGPKFAKSNIRSFYEDLQLGAIFEGSWTPNLNRPANGENTYLVFSTRADRPMFNLGQFSLKRETDEENPLGFGIVFDTGENTKVSRANASLSGNYYDLQQLWGEVRLPLGKGLTIRGGKMATLIGYEVLEPINNQIGRSWGFGYGIPFTHAGVWGTYPFSDQYKLTLGITHGWDNFLGRDAGIGGIAALSLGFSEYFSVNLSGSVGKEGDSWRHILDVITTSSIGNFDLVFNGDWGHQGPGVETPGGHWLVASLNPRYNFRELKARPDMFAISGRAEVFYDQSGLRLGTPQTLGAEMLTLHFQPFQTPYFPLQIRGEVRYDQSNQQTYFRASNPYDKQLTFAVGATLVYTDILGLFSKRKNAKN